MSNTIGILGGGNMGQAIIKGLLASGLYKSADVFVYDKTPETAANLHEHLGVQVADNAGMLAKEVDVLLLAIKPNVLPAVLTTITPVISEKQLVISIAAGINLERLESILGADQPIVRIMPNTPALVGEGMSAIAPNAKVAEEDLNKVIAMFNSFGKAEIVPESMIDAVVGVSGSSPAFVYMFIEALADGAVLEGMPRQAAYEFAAQAVLGSAKMVLESGLHPGALKDMVSSPGGTTIAGVQALEEKGFRGAVIDAVHVAAEKNRNM
jgi:pyrroline-5-carboxylate reductase